jgi:hypothetical protein
MGIGGGNGGGEDVKKVKLRGVEIPWPSASVAWGEVA